MITPTAANQAAVRNIRIELPKSLYPEQEEIVKYPYSMTVFGGRGCGKTRGAAKRILRKAVERPGLYWWVGLDWRSASMREAWEFLRIWSSTIWTSAGRNPKDYINDTNKTIILPGTAEDGMANQIWMRTAEHPESLAGKQINGAVGDEFTLWPRRVWDEYLRATTLVRKAWVCFIGVPKGENWASELWLDAKAGKLAGWKSLRIESTQNPLITKEAIDQIAINTPQWLVDQEYRGMIVKGVGRPFEGIRELVMDEIQEIPFVSGRAYYAAVDPAGGGADEMTLAITHKEDKKIVQDVLRAYVLETPNAVMDEFAALCSAYHIGQVVGDAYSGEWVRSAFRERGVHYEVSERTASDAYKELIPLVRQKRCAFLDDKIQTDQFVNLIHKQTAGGDDRVLHPPADHDDRCNAVTLAMLAANDAVEFVFDPNQKFAADPRQNESKNFGEQPNYGGLRSVFHRGFGR